MYKLTTIAILAMMLTQVLQAQVKRTYKDQKFSQQTVVVKEDTSVSDIDILNSQFNIDDIEVGEVIRITTETDPQNTIALQESKQSKENPAGLSEPKPEESPVKAVEEKEVTETTVEEPEVVQEPAPKAKEKFRGLYPNKSDVKRKNPRFKQKKRKKRKFKKKRCYRF